MTQEEFILECTAICNWVIAYYEGVFTGSFAEAEYKFFEGYNIPIKCDDEGKRIEPFDVAYNRVKEYFKVDSETRWRLVKQVTNHKHP